MSKSKFTFPVGYHDFHKDQVFNFQLNRWYSFGYAKFEDMQKVGRKIENFADWKRELTKLAEKAVSEKRLMNAAFYYRAAEFYTFEGDPDKEPLYDKFNALFYRAFKKDEIGRFKVPYKETFLPVMEVSPVRGKTKGTIVMFGGFDSYIEEFYSWMRCFADHGYKVIAFEGPGQGAARKKYGLALDWQWEKPVKAVLDYFNLEDVTLLGISMGGWFCFRAAAFEPRINRVIASSVAFDYLKAQSFLAQQMAKLFLKYFRKLTDNLMTRQMKKDKKYAWWASNLLYITDKQAPVDAVDVLLQLNAENLHSEMVKQDVLILTGREDHFSRFKMHDMQIKALTNARSVTGRVFTREEHAQNHCQIGNMGLALDVILDWIQQKT